MAVSERVVKAWAIQDRKTKHLRWIAYDKEQLAVTQSVLKRFKWRVVPVEIHIKGE